MSKNKTTFACAKCGAQSLKWSGRCFECGGWGTFKEELDEKNKEKPSLIKQKPAEIINLEKIQTKDYARAKTNISEVDRVLGGGIVPGSLTLLSGEPGIGKSTIVAQIANLLNSKSQKVLCASGEESAHQTKDRLARLNCDFGKIKFLSETNAEKIIATAKELKPALLIIDSIQTAQTLDAQGEVGGIAQIKATTAKFLELTKQSNIPTILIGHVTKDGNIAGPKNMEHMVDTVLYFEVDKTHHYRLLRATKNRFGSTQEVGIFEMTQNGFLEIKNPSTIFLENSQANSGSAISCVMEGTRPFLVEVQALVSKTFFGYPQRKTSGYDANRLQILTTVLTKRAGINLANQDVILNIVGGLKITDTALDLAVCFAIVSSLFDKIIDRQTIIFGEVGLNGEARNVSMLEARIKEAKKLGFAKIIIPDSSAKSQDKSLIRIKNVNQIIERATL